MKIVELILAPISIFFIIKGILFPGLTELTFFSIFTLSMIYFYSGFFLFNNINIIQLVGKFDFKTLDSVRVGLPIVTGFSLSVTMLGILFKIYFWPLANEMLIFGLSALLFISIACIVKYIIHRRDNYTGILLRVAIFGSIGLFLLFSSEIYLIEIKYKDYPAYIDAYKKHVDKPDDMELRKEMESEREKMYKEIDGESE